jgi:hypothetical protein
MTARSNTATVAARLAIAALALLVLSTPSRGQDAITKDTAAVVKTAFMADLDVMQGKFLGLAEAFPQDKYTWRPMDGVRSVSEVLMLAAMEGYSFIPTSFGAKAAALGSRDDTAKLRTLSDKAQVIDHVKKGFAHAKARMNHIVPPWSK